MGVRSFSSIVECTRCRTTFTAASATANGARAQARRQGWQVATNDGVPSPALAGIDLCPDCVTFLASRKGAE